MIYVVVCAAVALFGAAYALWPLRFLQRKYMYDEVPPTSIQTARVVGVLMAVGGAVGVVYNLVCLMG